MAVGRDMALKFANQFGWTPPPNVAPAAASAMDQLMTSWGQPLSIISAYRDPARNARAGGAKKSQHMHGNAFDVDVRDMPREQRLALIEQARANGFQGIGVYDNSLHFDVGGDRAWGPDYSRNSLPSWATQAVQSPVGGNPQGRMNFLPEGGTIADRPSMQTLADQGGNNSNRAVTPFEGKTLADLNEEMKGNKFHPGMALQSLGAAIAAGSQGESAAGDLGAIREAYFEQQQQEYQRAAEELQRQAAVEMVGGPDTELGQALVRGAPLDQVMSAHAQQQGFQHDVGMQQAGFGHAQDMYGRQSADQWGMLGARQGFEAEQNELERTEQTRQFEVTAGLARDKFNTDVEVSGNVGKAGKIAIGTMLEAAGDPVTAGILRSLPDSTFSDPSMLSTMMDALTSPETKDEATAAMKNWAYAQTLSAEDREAFLNASGSGTNISIGGGETGIPGLGKLSTDYAYAMNPDGSVQTDADGRAISYAVPGSPAALEQEQAAVTAESARTIGDFNTVSRGSHVMRSIDKALGDVGPHSTGLAHQATGWISGTPAANLEQTISTISSNIAFDRLTEMRNESKTGAALGSISNFELEQLQNTIASLSVKQGPGQLQENLNYVKSHYESIIQRVINSNADDASKAAVLRELGVSIDEGSTDNLSIDDLTTMYAD